MARIHPVAAELRERRIALGWSQYKLAVKSGVSRNTIARIETGRTMPSLDILDYLLPAMGLEMPIREVQTVYTPNNPHLATQSAKSLSQSRPTPQTSEEEPTAQN